MLLGQLGIGIRPVEVAALQGGAGGGQQRLGIGEGRRHVREDALRRVLTVGEREVQVIGFPSQPLRGVQINERELCARLNHLGARLGGDVGRRCRAVGAGRAVELLESRPVAWREVLFVRGDDLELVGGLRGTALMLGRFGQPQLLAALQRHEIARDHLRHLGAPPRRSG